MDLSDKSGDDSSDISIQDDSTSDEETLYELLFYDSDVDDEEEGTEEFLQLLVTAAASNEERVLYHVRDRMVWNEHVADLLEEGPLAFTQYYRMSLESFNRLCLLLHPLIIIDPVMSEVRTTKAIISTEIIVSCFLRWIGGGSYLDLRTAAGISIASFYRIIHLCVSAILNCKDLCYYFPTNAADIQAAADAFKTISSNEAVEGCVGCIDGFLLRVKVPPAALVGNVKCLHL
jgi:hypothetical protein